jgi:hypothetical protein
MIFQEATAVWPDLLDNRTALCFMSASSMRWSAYRRCMRTKLALSLVSRSFHELAQAILFDFVWIRRAGQAKILAHTLIFSDVVLGLPSAGRHIRHLHIETPMFERCAPEDVRTILAYAPQLQIYTDNNSMRRWRYDPSPDPKSAPSQLFALLARPDNALRRLAWTTYSDEPFHLDMAAILSHKGTVARLEYLELSTSSAFDLPRQEAHAAASSPLVCLPALRALKASLDNTTFMVLSDWSMPELKNLSVVSSDFSYAGEGFAAFFRAHGTQLAQLELGHSSTQVTEHRLTPPGSGVGSSRLKLAEWCPNLKEFICSADAQWDWINPDWIAPHVLMPAHPTLEFIAIRDIDSRLRSDGEVMGNANIDDPAPFFPLLEQLSSLLRDGAFPRLRYMRDLSEESHRMRMKEPQPRITRFWERVIYRCSQKGVWCEDWEGVNVTLRGLKRATLRIGQ